MPGCAATVNTLQLELLDNTTACSASLYSDRTRTRSHPKVHGIPSMAPGNVTTKCLSGSATSATGSDSSLSTGASSKDSMGFPQRESLKPTQTSGQVDTGLNQEEASLIPFSWAGMCSSRSWRDVVHDG